MPEGAVDVTFGDDVDGVELDEVWFRAVCWDFQDLEVMLADAWFACEPLGEPVE